MTFSPNLIGSSAQPGIRIIRTDSDSVQPGIRIIHVNPDAEKLSQFVDALGRRAPELQINLDEPIPSTGPSGINLLRINNQFGALPVRLMKEIACHISEKNLCENIESGLPWGVSQQDIASNIIRKLWLCGALKSYRQLKVAAEELMTVYSASASSASAASPASTRVDNESKTNSAEELAALKAQLQLREAEVTRLHAQLESSRLQISTLELKLNRQIAETGELASERQSLIMQNSDLAEKNRQLTFLNIQLESKREGKSSMQAGFSASTTTVTAASPTSGATVRSLPFDVKYQITLAIADMLSDFVESVFDGTPVKDEILCKIRTDYSKPPQMKADEVMECLEKHEVSLIRLKQTLEALHLNYTASKIPV